VNYRNGPDSALLIRFEYLFQEVRISPPAPVPRDQFDLQSHASCNVRPFDAELPGLEHENPICGTKGVHQGGLPRAGAGTGVHDHGSRGVENLAEPLLYVSNEFREVRASVVPGRSSHRCADSLGDVGWAWNLKEVPAGRIIAHRGLALKDEGGGRPSRKTRSCGRRVANATL
jgi:hypothetical protein